MQWTLRTDQHICLIGTTFLAEENMIYVETADS
jgi:hypothetical protein